jgi:hypothetical protein
MKATTIFPGNSPEKDNEEEHMKKSTLIMALVVALIAAAALGGPPALAAGAAKALTVVGIPVEGDNLNAQPIKIANPNSEDITVTYGYVRGGSTVPAGSTTVPAKGTRVVSLDDPGMNGFDCYISYEDTAGTTKYAFGKSSNSYYAFIQYLAAGTVIHEEKVAVKAGSPAQHTAPAVYKSQYRLTSQATLNHVFNSASTMNQRTLKFEYEKIVPQSYDITIQMVERSSGKLLDSATVTVPVDGTATYTAPSSLSAGGKNYVFSAGEKGKISHGYATGAKTYQVYYDRDADAPAKPYSITIRYMDANTGLVLYSTNVTVPVGQTVTVNVKDRVISEQGVEYLRDAGQPSVIRHAANQSARRYDVLFSPAPNATAPYDITIIYADAQTGAHLGSALVHVDRNATARHTAPDTLTANGAQYAVASGSSREIAHAFANNTRVYTVYYNKAGSAGVSGYDITVKLVNAATNQVLSSQTVAVPVRTNISHVVPANLTVDGVEYALAAGQSQIVRHDFSASRRVYSVFYRNAAEAAEETTTTTTTTTTTIAAANNNDNGATTTVTAQETTTTAQETATTSAAVTITEATVPLDDGNNDAETTPTLVTIPDQSVPLAVSGGGSSDGGSGWVWAIVAAVAVIGGGLLMMGMKNNRREEKGGR